MHLARHGTFAGITLGALLLLGYVASLEGAFASNAQGTEGVSDSIEVAPPRTISPKIYSETDGYDPETPGCHVSWANDGCTGQMTYDLGEGCEGEYLIELEGDLAEDECHNHDGVFELWLPHYAVDCEEYCMETYSLMGFCTEVANWCGPHSSAYCLCVI